MKKNISIIITCATLGSSILVSFTLTAAKANGAADSISRLAIQTNNHDRDIAVLNERTEKILEGLSRIENKLDQTIERGK